MQSDDSSKDKSTNIKLITSYEVDGDRTLVQEVGFGGDSKSDDMEVDNVDFIQRRDTSNFEGKSVSGDAEMDKGFTAASGCVSKEENCSENSSEIKAATKANFNSFEQQLFRKPDSSISKVVEPENTVGEVKKSTFELVKQAAMSKEPEIKDHVDEEGVSEDPKGVSSVVDLDAEKGGENKVGFCVSDLVWGKVRSHAWWPGQIFEPGDASDKAKKYSKSKAYLVGYFGDHTFAWNVEASLKPFVPNFSEMAKQTTLKAFRHALGCVLDEVSRRVEFGLSCGCIADDVYNRLKTQVIENPGIQIQSRIQQGGDRFFTVSSFEPIKFLHYVKDLAQGPNTDVDKLEHVMAQARMTAFYRWKGIYHLAEFGPLIGYVNNEADAPVTAEKESCDVIQNETPSPEIMEEDATRPQKRKKISMSGDGGSSKKAKCLADLVSKKSVSKKGDKVTEGKGGSKPILYSGKKQKDAKLFGNDSKTKESSPMETTVHVTDSKSSLGERFLKVAGQLSQRSPLLKSNDSSRGKTKKDEGNSKRFGTHSSKHGSLDAIVLELRLAAIKPLKEHSLLTNMVTFISDFRNSVVPDNELLQKHEDSTEEDTTGNIEDVCFTGGNSKEKASESQVSIISNLDAVEDARCSNKTSGVLKNNHGVSTGSQVMDSIDGSVISASVGGGVEKMQLEDSSTALILKFSDVDSIPTEAKLIKIFSHFGPLKESETEVLAKTSCARVVFKRRSDAETAFSSSGKFGTFGPSLVCYRLNYAPSPRKSSSGKADRKKMVDSH